MTKPFPPETPPPSASLPVVLAVVAAGGALGALARYGLGTAFPHHPAAFPWTTFGINVTGCLLIGILMVLVTEAYRVHPLVRPFLGTGVLGGYTTFSTYAVDVHQLIDAGAAGTALGYLVATLLAALAATTIGLVATRRIVGVPR